MAERVAEQVGVNNLGTIPDTKSRFGRLYIRDWKVTSAIIETGYLQRDFEIIKNNQKDFGRAIARAILEYLHVSPTCADSAVRRGTYVSTYFPSDTTSHTIRILNDGVIPWQSGECELRNVGETYGAQETYSLSGRINPGEIAEWEVPVRAPDSPNVYQQEWQLHRAGESVGNVITVTLLVFPPRAKELKEDIGSNSKSETGLWRFWGDFQTFFHEKE